MYIMGRLNQHWYLGKNFLRSEEWINGNLLKQRGKTPQSINNMCEDFNWEKTWGVSGNENSCIIMD